MAPEQPTLPRQYRCADLEIDVGLQRVSRNGTELPLPKLSFELLLALLEAAPNFVSNKQLMARVWPGLVVAEKTVSQRVKLLRDAIADDPTEPRYVVGLRGRGYRLKPEVVRGLSGAEKPSESAAAPAVASSANAAATLVRRAAFALLALAALAIGARTLLPGAPSEPSRAVAGGSERTVAVLPFRADGSASSSGVELGIAETILDRLSMAEGLDVIARASSFKAAPDWEPAETGRRLGARYLVEGTVRQTDDALRVTARLLDADDATQIWAETFETGVADVFAVEDTIAERVTDALRRRIGRVAPPAATKQPTENTEAYLAFLRGRAALARWTAADADVAEAELTRAITLDPNFAAAYAALYDARMMAVQQRSGASNPNANRPRLSGAGEQNGELIERALALEPDSGAAHFARAIWAADYSAATERDFRIGIERDPSNGRGITAFAEFLDRTDRPAEAEQMLERALRIDPLSPRAHFWQVMRQFPVDAATLEAGMLRVLEIDPNYLPALQRYSKYRWLHHGALAEAIELIEQALARDAENPWLAHAAVAMYLDAGDRAAAGAIVAAAARPEVAGRLLLDVYDGNVDAAAAAAFDDAAFANGIYENWLVYEALRDGSRARGDAERALQYLEQRTKGDPVNVEYFRAGPVMAELIRDARSPTDARDLLRRLIQWIDDVHVPTLGNTYALRIKATALLDLGETELALQALDASFRAKDYVQWWYTLERDPLWEPLHGDPRFAAIAARVAEHVKAQRAALDALRSAERVPRRATYLAERTP